MAERNKRKISCGKSRNSECNPQFNDETKGPCSEKCICYLNRTVVQIKKKIAEQSRILKEFASSNDEIRCNVELTPSEEKLFGAGVVKDDSMVCCLLVRELRAQKRDLEIMMSSWVEFADKADRFALVITEIRDKLTELTSRIDTILHETKALEEIELANEEKRARQIDEVMRRSEQRREIFREAVDRFTEAEARHHLEYLARREKLDALERDRLLDRAALKLAIEKMMKVMIAMNAPEPTMNIGTFGESSVVKPQINELSRSPGINVPPHNPPIQISSPLCYGNHEPQIIQISNSPQTNFPPHNPPIQISRPHRYDYQDPRNGKKSLKKPGTSCRETFCQRTTARRPF